MNTLIQGLISNPDMMTSLQEFLTTNQDTVTSAIISLASQTALLESLAQAIPNFEEQMSSLINAGAEESGQIIDQIQAAIMNNLIQMMFGNGSFLSGMMDGIINDMGTVLTELNNMDPQLLLEELASLLPPGMTAGEENG